MDNSLTRVQHRKVPVEVLDVDVPELARALTAIARGQGTVRLVRIGDATYAQVTGLGAATLVPRPAWLRLLPLIKDGTLSGRAVPLEGAVRPLDPPTRDARDPLYLRVESVLRNLFQSKVPT